MLNGNNQVYTRNEIRITAIQLYIKGLPVLVDYLKVAVSKEIHEVLKQLTDLLPQCNMVSDRLTFWPNYVTEDQFQEFVNIVGETEKCLNQVDLESLYSH